MSHAVDRNKCVGYIIYSDPCLILSIIDCERKVEKLCLHFQTENIEQLLDRAPRLLGGMKAVICNTDEVRTNSPDTDIFCNKLKKIIDGLSIPLYFVDAVTFGYTIILVASNIKARLGDVVSMAASGATTTLSVVDLKFGMNGYEMIDSRRILMDERRVTDLRVEVVGENSPRCFLIQPVTFNPVVISKLNKMRINVKFYSTDVIKHTLEAVTAISKWMLDKTYVRFRFNNRSIYYCSVIKYNDGLYPRILEIDVCTKLPALETLICNTSNGQFLLGSRCKNEKNDRIVCEIPYDHGYERHLISLKIDCQNFINATIEPLVSQLPAVLCSTGVSSTAVIGLFWNKSVLLTRECSSGYQFADSWNGINGKDLYISFTQKRPRFFSDAMEDLKLYPRFVIYDIIKVISMPDNDVKIDPKWSFTITEDETYPKLFEFDTFQASMRQAYPEFLMAMIIRQHLKVLGHFTGNPIKNLGFCLLDDFGDNDTQKLIIECLKNACEMLPVDFTFINL